MFFAAEFMIGNRDIRYSAATRKYSEEASAWYFEAVAAVALSRRPSQIGKKASVYSSPYASLMLFCSSQRRHCTGTLMRVPYLDEILEHRLEVLKLAIVERVDTNGALIC